MESIGEIKLFGGIGAEKLAAIERQCSVLNYDEHELVVDYADDTTDVRFILSGGVRVIFRAPSGKEMILGEIGAGHFFGELAAIDGDIRSANITTLSRSRILSMPASVFRKVLSEYPDIGFTVMQVLTRRIRSLNQRIAEHSFLDAKYRLYNELIRLSRPRSGQPSQRIISPPPNQSEIAETIGCRREVVSREIARLKAEEILDASKGGLILLKPEKLSQMLTAAWSGD